LSTDTPNKQRIGWSGKVWRAWESVRGRNCWYVVYWPDGEPHTDERAVVLRRTRYRWQASRWIRNWGAGIPTPILVTPHDVTPQHASKLPLYPYPDRPLGTDFSIMDRALGKRGA